MLRGVLGDPKALAVPALPLVLVGQQMLPGKDLQALLAQAQMMASRMLVVTDLADT